ncbi:MAG: ABC transporter ATP-binding protein [Bacilli bacterium]
MSILCLNKVGFSYGKHQILKEINYSFEKGNIYAIVGKSGSGKTTLLSVLSGLADPTQGEVLYKGIDLKTMDKYKFRSSNVGIVFQAYNLLTTLTAKENVVLGMDIAGIKVKNKSNRAEELLLSVGIDYEEMDRPVLKLSGGQQQRVAIARTLSYDPEIILADEPTGNLDPETQKEIINLFKKLSEDGRCIIMVTHSKTVSAAADIKYQLG